MPGSFAYATLRSDLVAERLLIERLLDELRGRRPVAPELALDIRRLLHAIHEDPFDSDLSVASLKERCRIRDNNISSRFRFVLGVTIRHYIEILRLEAAALLLTRLDVGVFDIALSIGYQNPQTFYNAFRRKFDCTPSDFRRLHAGRQIAQAVDRVMSVQSGTDTREPIGSSRELDS